MDAISISPALPGEGGVSCPRSSQKTLTQTSSTKRTMSLHPVDEEETLLRIVTCLANIGYHKEVGVMVQLNRRFWGDEQIWDAHKDVRGEGGQGRTRLMCAASEGRIDRLRFYLDRGANVNKGSYSNSTALMGASERGHIEIVRELCERGATTTDDGYTASSSHCFFLFPPCALDCLPPLCFRLFTPLALCLFRMAISL